MVEEGTPKLRTPRKKEESTSLDGEVWETTDTKWDSGFIYLYCN